MSFEMVEKMIPSGELASNCIIAGNPKNPPLLLLHGAGPGASAMSVSYTHLTLPTSDLV